MRMLLRPWTVARASLLILKKHNPVGSAVRQQGVGKREPSRCSKSRGVCMAPPVRAFVGESTRPAGEYHCADFEWKALLAEVEASGIFAGPSVGPSEGWAAPPDAWERFHARENASARFYRERRYLLLEFPALQCTSPPQHFLEIGCGCGSSLLPVLKANAACHVTASDVSATAVQLFRSAAEKLGINSSRYEACVRDGTAPGAFAGLEADGALLIFTLAALSPSRMPALLANVFQALKPGGLLMVRDHGLLDLTHLRLAPERRIADNHYWRTDATTCYFFSTEDLQQRAEAAGFETVECAYHCVVVRNRQLRLDMKRVFVHGLFRRP